MKERRTPGQIEQDELVGVITDLLREWFGPGPQPHLVAHCHPTTDVTTFHMHGLPEQLSFLLAALRAYRGVVGAGGGKLYVTIGLSGSGKTTRARKWVAEDPRRRKRVNRDDLRDMELGGWTGEPEDEHAITLTQDAGLIALLGAGFEVVVDDTNLHLKTRAKLREIARVTGSEYVEWDMTDVDVNTCIDRDAGRLARGERHVGEKVIWRQFAQLMTSRGEAP